MHQFSVRLFARGIPRRQPVGAVFLFLVALGLCPPATAAFQGQRYSRIVGQVRLPPGESKLPDLVRVTLSALKGGQVEEKAPSADATFVFDHLRWGQYVVTATSPGYQPGVQTIEVAPRSFEVRVLVSLGPRIEDPEGQPRRGEETVSVDTLTIPPKALKEMEKARRRARDGNFEKAVHHYRKALELCSQCYQAYEALGLFYASQGQWTEATGVFEESVVRDPENAAARRNLAQTLLRQKAFDRALEHLGRAASIEPDSGQTLSLLGEAYLGLRNCEIALEHFQRAAEINPGERSYLGLGRGYYCLGKTAEALAEFKEFVRQRPSDPRSEKVREFVAQLEKALGSQD